MKKYGGSSVNDEREWWLVLNRENYKKETIFGEVKKINRQKFSLIFVSTNGPINEVSKLVSVLHHHHASFQLMQTFITERKTTYGNN